MRNFKVITYLLQFLLIFASVADGATTRAVDADTIRSTNHAKIWTPPAATDTLLGRISTDTVTNKSMSGSANTFTNIGYASLNLTGTLVNADISSSAAIAYSKLSLTGSILNADISGSAAIARSKLASGSNSHVLINDVSGVMSSEAQLATTRGGTGISSTATFPASGTVTTDAGASTLTNKAISGVGNTLTNLPMNQASGVLPFVNGGTASTTASGAIAAMLPAYASNSGKYLTNDGASTLSWGAPTATVPVFVNGLSNCSIAATVASSAMTILLKDAAGATPSGGSSCKIAFRNVTSATGTVIERTVSAALSTIISSGSTAGHTSGNPHMIFVYAIDNAGTVELAWSSKVWDESVVQSTTAEGGAGAADLPNVLYSTTARTNVPIRLIGRLDVTEVTAGTWASVPTNIIVGAISSLAPKIVRLYLNTGNGYGSTNVSIRRYTTQVEKIGNIAYVDDATNGMSVTVLVPGKYEIVVQDYKTTGPCYKGISRNASSGVTGITALTATQRLGLSSSPTNSNAPAIATAMLDQGDVIRSHMDTQCDGTIDYEVNFYMNWVGY